MSESSKRKKAALKEEKKKLAPPPDFDMRRAVDEIEPWDQEIYDSIIATELSAQQIESVVNPQAVYPKQKAILAVHWHPEWIPFDLITRRIRAMYPNTERELIIPTQHNKLLTYGEYAGVEVDCYSSGFNRKVQLLLHFEAEKVKEAHILRSMLEHTANYRSSQLFEFMGNIINPDNQHRLEEAVGDTGANEELVELVRFYTARLSALLDMNESRTPSFMIKNKLLTEYISAQRMRHPDITINRALLLIKAVKETTKRNFSFDYFFRASEVIEEARGLGGGIVIPHPEQFWPILLAGYDVDGWEVWNPQSREYTEFLVRALNTHNKQSSNGRRPLLIFMGDDTHMSVKIKDPATLERSKLEREIGLQPVWDEIGMRKTLSLVGASRESVIEQYKERLA